MTFKELLEQLQALSSEELAGKADVLDTKTNKYYPIKSLYNERFTSGFCTQRYTFITIRTKE